MLHTINIMVLYIKTHRSKISNVYKGFIEPERSKFSEIREEFAD